MLRATHPDHPPFLRDEGGVLLALRRHGEAAGALQAYLDAAPGAEEAGVVRALIEKCREKELEEELVKELEEEEEGGRPGLEGAGGEAA